MQRNRTFQPTTKNTQDLTIGLAKISIGQSDDTTAASDVAGGMTSVGAIKNGSVSMKPSLKEHKSGYPGLSDFKITDVLNATHKVEVEEVGDPVVLDLIDDSIVCLETGAPIFRSIESLSEFATGGTLSLFSNHAQLKPNLTMNFGNDFNSIPFEFEALANPAFANRQLVYRKRVNAAGRSLANQPITKSPDSLAIGMFQVRIGKPAKRKAGAASITPAQLRKAGTGVIASRPVPASAGAYTGQIDGAIVLKCTEAVDNAIVFDVFLPDGTPGAPITIADNTPVAIGATGVTIAFDSALAAKFSAAGNTDADTVSYGDVYVIGCYTSSALSKSTTGIVSPYSFLTAADSVGSIKTSSMTTQATFKEHTSGYPQVRDLLMLESSSITIAAGLEEIDAATTALITGQGETFFDMLFDSSINGELYYVPVEIVTNLATGGILSFWFPNCQIVPDATFAPGNDWTNLPLSLDAQVQVGAGVQRIYRQSIVTL